MSKNDPAERAVRDIRRKTRKQYSAEEKIRIVVSGLRGEDSIAGDLAAWLEDQGMDHIRGAPNHPQTQGKIERWHQTLKNRVLLENYYLPGDLEASVGTFVEHYNHRRYHESLANLTPADVYFGRDHAIIERRRKIKNLTIKKRRLAHHNQAA